MTVGLVAGAVLLSGCSQKSDQEQSSIQQQAPSGQLANKQTEAKAWADALAAGSVTAFNTYLENFGAGPHAAEARARLATLEAQARREADEKAWSDASRSDTAAADIEFRTGPIAETPKEYEPPLWPISKHDCLWPSRRVGNRQRQFATSVSS